MKGTRNALFPVWLILGLVASLLLINSCRHNGIPADQMEPICFTEQVLPIFQNSCGTSGCHDAKSSENEYIFTDYAHIMKAITSGDASKSKAYEAMISTFEIMPPNNPLPQNKRALVRLWIEQGAKQTTCGK